MDSKIKSDLNFLLDRAMKAGQFNFLWNRDVGSSSNSIVAIAYGLYGLDKQILPRDAHDLNACKNMWKKLPAHRKSKLAKEAMERAENYKNEPGNNRAAL